MSEEPTAGTRPDPTGSGDIWRRAAARLLDEVIVGVVLGVTLFATGSFESIAARITPPLVTLAYFVLFEGRFAMTPGKFLFGFQVVSTEGRQVDFRQAFARNWWIGLSLVPYAVPHRLVEDSAVGLFLVIGVSIYIAVTISASESNQGFHDRMADTLVVLR